MQIVDVPVPRNTGETGEVIRVKVGGKNGLENYGVSMRNTE